MVKVSTALRLAPMIVATSFVSSLDKCSEREIESEERLVAAYPDDLVPMQNLRVRSPDGSRTALIAKRDAAFMIVVNAYIGKPRQGILLRQVGFSPDSRHFVFLAQRENKVLVVQDDTLEGPEYDEILRPEEVATGNPVFSKTGGRLAYVAKKGETQVVVAEGRELRECDRIYYLMYSPDGTALTYTCETAGRVRVFAGQNESRDYERLLARPVWSATGRLAFAGLRDGRAYLIVDNQEVADHFKIAGVALSPDGARVAFVAESAGGVRVIVDGVPGPEQQRASGVLFSQDGRRVAYHAGNTDSSWVVVDGVRGKGYILIQELQFDSSGARVAYKAANRDGWRVVINGVEGKTYSDLAPQSLRFSPNGHHFSYVARLSEPNDTQERWTAVLDGSEGPEYINAVEPAFSPDSRHVAYVGQVMKGYHIAIDESRSKLLPLSVSKQVWFNESNEVFAQGYPAHRIVHVFVKVPK